MIGPGLQIVGHKLAGIGFQASPNVGGILKPECILIHYTAGASAQGAIKFLCDREAKVSAHLVIAQNGLVTQLVPFDRIAWHAGKSVWQGRPALNSWSVGIELVNLGCLAKQGVKARHKNGGPEVTWQDYPEPQLESLEAVCRALLAHYPIRLILGHDDVAPGRKLDPGPAFPMARFQSLLEPTQART